MRVFFASVFICLSGAAFAADGEALSLEQAFSMSLARSETLAQQGETAAGLEAKIAEMEANLRPRVSLFGTQIWQDTPGAADVSGPMASTKPQYGFNLHHALYSGMRDMLSVKSAKTQAGAARQAYERARQLLYQDTAQAYMNLLFSAQELEIRRAQIELTRSRITELSAREKIGRSRASEVMAARSQLALNEAQLAQALGSARVYQWTFRFLTGLESDAKVQSMPQPEHADIKPYLAACVLRPDAEQQRRNIEAADIFADSQSRQKLPSAAVDANYYLERPSGSAEHVYWDAAFSFSLPLYLAGSVDAQVKAAQSAARSARLGLTLAMRQAYTDVQSAYDGLASALHQARALEAAFSAARANSKAQEDDYRLGLVTNLDVLSAQSSAEDTRLQLEAAKAAAVLAKIRLEVAAGMK
ncbi:MAG: TolC family protein [Elusimicrobiales bacterium]